VGRCELPLLKGKYETHQLLLDGCPATPVVDTERAQGPASAADTGSHGYAVPESVRGPRGPLMMLELLAILRRSQKYMI